MAFFYDETLDPPRKPNLFVRLGHAISDAMTRSAERQSRRAAILALEAKSDRELADMGLRRDEIAQHVFRDILYV